MNIKSKILWIIVMIILTLLSVVKKTNRMRLLSLILFFILVLLGKIFQYNPSILMIFILLGFFLLLAIYGVKKFLSLPNSIGLNISKIIESATYAYLKSKYKVILLVVALMTPIIYYIFDGITLVSFLMGATVSMVGGILSIFIGTKGNIRVLNGVLNNNAPEGARIATASGTICSVILHVMNIAALTIAFTLEKYFPNSQSFIGLAIGTALFSMFARVGGGIYTKAADVGADLVGKGEFNLAEDDPRNPGTIADNVGDNVGDLMGMGAELTESYIGGVGAVYLLSKINGLSFNKILYVLMGGIIAAIGSFFVIFFNTNIKSLMDQFFTTSGIILTTLGIVGEYFGILTFAQSFSLGLGVLAVLSFLKLTSYYTESKYYPIKSIVKGSQTGHGTNVIAGLSVGLESAAVFISVLIAFIVAIFRLKGSLSVFSLTFLAFAPSILVLDIFGPISDNAGGIAELNKCDSEVREKTDKLDIVGNTTKAVTKGYACASTVLTAMLLFKLFLKDIRSLFNITMSIDVSSSFGFLGILLGSIIPYIFSSLTIGAVSIAANKVANEIRKQFKENPGILKGKIKPNINGIITYLSKLSIKSMILPCIIPLIIYLILLLIYKTGGIGLNNYLNVIGAITLGSTISAVSQSIFMCTSGGAWDNAKKFSETINDKKSPTHQATITGDTVGDPLKDTSGPALCSLAKFINIIALLFTFGVKVA